ncbi:hypothetical protein CHISP_3494 [Chitinispirillum alkaliphilum]|nr:hypothetical protein CHISP_3494 [Chitinispirillum alkaliphilum]
MNNNVYAFLAILTIVFISFAEVCDTVSTENGMLITCKETNLNGIVIREESFLSGKRHGNLIDRYDNGAIRRKWKYYKGCPVDTLFRYY